MPHSQFTVTMNDVVFRSHPTFGNVWVMDEIEFFCIENKIYKYIRTGKNSSPAQQ